MRTIQGLTGVLVLLAAAQVQAVDMKAAGALAQQKACLACHALDRKVVGPAFKDVAKRYKGKAAMVDAMAVKIKKGGAGAWGTIPMPANNVSDAEAKMLAQWVMAQ